jgi:hypothetical protein
VNSELLITLEGHPVIHHQGGRMWAFFSFHGQSEVDSKQSKEKKAT